MPTKHKYLKRLRKHYQETERTYKIDEIIHMMKINLNMYLQGTIKTTNIYLYEQVWQFHHTEKNVQKFISTHHHQPEIL